MKELMEKLEALLEIGGVKRDVTLLVISGIALLFSLTGMVELPFSIAWVAIILCGLPIILEAIIGLVTAFDIKADVLVSLALIASVCIGEYFAAGEVAFIMQIGALLEDLTVAKAREGIEKLVKLTPQTARIIVKGKEKILPADQVKKGDIIRVLPGESIPVDGVILAGQTSINQAIMTGESLPVDKTVGDEVSSGTVNQFGAFDMEATKVGEDSSIQRMIKLVQSADAGKAKIVGIADRWATWIVVIALTAAALTWLISGQIIRAVTILVVFCPCALVLATPTAIMAAIGNATRHGFLVREGDALERLAKVNTIAFDKTGTLTYGKLMVTAFKSLLEEFSDEEIFSYAAASERFSEHPIGKAILAAYKEQIKKEVLDCEEFQMTVGRGVSSLIEGKRVLAGNPELLAEHKISLEVTKEMKAFYAQGSTVIYLGIDGKFAGYIVLSDVLREESRQMIGQLSSLGVSPVLLTGDNKNAAESIAKRLGITNFQSECLPEDKLNYISEREKDNQLVCMIGDGINDAPALKRATVGIAMGGVGSDIAVDAADIALVDDEVKELPHLLAISKKMMRTIKLNMTFSMCLNFVAIILAIIGTLNPVVGALVHNAGSVLVIINSSLLLKWKSEIPG
jgi:heavy metal translocating P-type ATPase